MKPIIPPIDKALIEQELTEDKFVRETNNGGNLLYIFSAQDSPLLMQEVGRLREESFRHAGGGTGEEVDIDEYDTGEHQYHQLIVWDPDAHQILGGYRFQICDHTTIDANGNVLLSTAELFKFSQKFKEDYLPYTIELGRSFVVPAYQSTSRLRKGMYALDNLWDGLGAIIVENPDKKYFFGKVTMYTSYNIKARNHLLYFLDKHFSDKDELITPIETMETHMDRKELMQLFNHGDYKEDYKVLSKSVRQMGEFIPPLINSYMNLSPTMKVFGTAINHHFGDVEETAIMVTIKDIYQAKVERHIRTYAPRYWFQRLRKRTHIPHLPHIPHIKIFPKRKKE